MAAAPADLTAPDAVEESALDPVDTAAATTATATPPTPEPAPAPKPAQTSSLEKPSLQIGIFSVEENALNTAEAMRQNGMVPTVKKQSAKGKTFWRVIVGPAANITERNALLRKVKGVGFDDAYPVTN